MASQDGYIADVNALTVGRTAVLLGAGRLVADEPVDPTAGVLFHKKVGQVVAKGDAVAILYCNRSEEVLDKARKHIVEAIEYSTTPVHIPAIITHHVTTDGVREFTMPMVLLDDEVSK